MVETDWDGLIDELRLMRGALDKIAARVTSEKTRHELMPIWDCGHRHAGRDEAIACKRSQAA